MGLDDVVMVNGFVADRRFVPAYRKVFLERLGGARPTSTLVVAELIDPRLLVEIEVIAARAPAASGGA
jgi:enamine deaminase RidA (YjgF/YER057c/UK114 family)